MKKAFGLVCCLVAFAALAACATGNGGKDGGGDGGKNCGTKCGGGGDNPMMQIMYDNTKEAMYWVPCHKDAAAGQYWETKMTAAGQTSTEKWQIAAIQDGMPIVEQLTQWGFVIAYHVDTNASEGAPNVVKAWKGKPNGKPEEIPVMKKPEPTGTEPGPSDWIVETKEEDFFDVEMGGGKWSGKKITMTMKHKNGKDWSETVTWKADNAWFDGVIKMTSTGEFSGYKSESSKELVATKSDSAAWLSWG